MKEKQLPKELSEWLSDLGFGRKSLLKLRFGGVVGKMALVAISFMVVAIVVAYKAEGVSMLWGCLGADG